MSRSTRSGGPLSKCGGAGSCNFPIVAATHFKSAKVLGHCTLRMEWHVQVTFMCKGSGSCQFQLGVAGHVRSAGAMGREKWWVVSLSHWGRKSHS